MIIHYIILNNYNSKTKHQKERNKQANYCSKNTLRHEILGQFRDCFQVL